MIYVYDRLNEMLQIPKMLAEICNFVFARNILYAIENI